MRKNWKAIAFVGLIAPLLQLGCGNDDGPTPTGGTCDYPFKEHCIDYIGSGHASARLKETCEYAGGAFSSASCSEVNSHEKPTANCLEAAGTASEIQTWYYSDNLVSPSLLCQQGNGVWTLMP
jgi:hypothetical protein